MKRDMKLIRLLLLGLAGETVNLEQYNREQILYHKNLLLDGELAKGNALLGDGKLQSVVLTDLTWEGHDFLDAIRNDNVWNKTIQSLGKIGGDASFTVIKSVAAAIAKELLGL